MCLHLLINRKNNNKLIKIIDWWDLTISKERDLLNPLCILFILKNRQSNGNIILGDVENVNPISARGP